jgi:hypothetical protein
VGGDRDSDSLLDYAVLAQPGDSGFIDLLSGDRDDPIATFRATSDCRSFGSVVLDVDAIGDGMLDVIAFEYSADAPCPQEATTAYVYDGMTLEAATFPVDPPGFVRVQSTGDFDGDGRGDLLAAFPFAHEGCGELQLISSVSGEVLRRFDEAGGLFGLLFSACKGGDDTIGFAVGGGAPYAEHTAEVWRLGADGDATRLAEGRDVCHRRFDGPSFLAGQVEFWVSCSLQISRRPP